MRRKSTQRTKQSQMIYGRFLLIVAFWVIWMGVIGVTLVHVQVNQHDWLVQRAMKQRREKIVDRHLRGTIYDRFGKRLAASVEVETLYIKPAQVENPDATGKQIAAVLKEKPQEVIARLKSAQAAGKKKLRLAAELDDEKADKLKSMNIAGLIWEKDQKRVYPNGSGVAHVVGFSNIDDKGQSGIELSQEANLRGGDISGYMEHDRWGRVYEIAQNPTQAPKDVYLTINSSFQYEAEKALAAGIQAAGAKGGTAIVLDPKTGEILAMASAPTFDLNKYGEASKAAWTNRNIQDMYSPGSTFKLITYAAGLDSGVISPDQQIDCNNGSIMIGSRRITDGHPLGIAPLSKALAVSNNVAAIKIGQMVNKDRMYDYAKRFGMGSQTGVELPAESGGVLHSTKNWSGESLASLSIGYEVGVTSLQMAAAYGAIANDGLKVQPHVVSEIKEGENAPTYVANPQKVQVVSANAARSLRRLMRDVVIDGTGRRAQLEGYTVAGKTGTAWKYDAKKGYSEGKRVSSFIGMAPADNPAVVIAVMIDEPTSGGDRSGGTVAAPVFKAIAEQVLPQMNILPDRNIRPDLSQAAEAVKQEKEGIDAPPGGKPVVTDDKKVEAIGEDKSSDAQPKNGLKIDPKKDQKSGEKKAPERADKSASAQPKKPDPKAKDDKSKLKSKPGNKT